MNRIFKTIAVFLVAAILLFASACTASQQTDDSTKPEATSGVRYDSDGNLLYKPEDVGEFYNPIVHTLISPPPSKEDWLWKEEAYGLELDYDTCAWADREMKWVSSYVSGTAYDLMRIDYFPTVVIKGLVQPYDDYLDITDERYFNQITVENFVWNSKHYAVDVIVKNKIASTNTGLYGVWYNTDFFEDVGQKTPLEYYEEGEWTFENLRSVASAMHQDVDRDGVVDIVGLGCYVNDLWAVCNGGKTVDFQDGEIKLTWNEPKFIEGLDFYATMTPYSKVLTFSDLMNGNTAMFVERLQYATTIHNAESSYSFDWVPLPKGPSGSGEQLMLIGGYALGAGAKNVSGALAWICADIGMYDYIEENTTEIYYTPEQAARANEVAHLATYERYSDIGNLEATSWSFWSSVKVMGAKAAIEKFTHTYQGQIDIVLSDTKLEQQEPFKAPDVVDFEDGDAFLTEIYPESFSIVTDSDEVISGAASLKIQLKPENAYGPIAITTAEDVSLPYGGSYKISFKAKAVGGTATSTGTLLVEFRPSSDARLTENAVKVKSYNPIDLTSGEVVDVEIDLEVKDIYSDLQIVFVGNTNEDNPNLAIILDDLLVEKV